MTVVAPSHPGFGSSPRAADFDTMYDLVQLYRAVIASFGDAPVTLIGFSFGGWIAAELATLQPPNLDRLVLVDPLGIKLSARDTRDITHLFNTTPDELMRLSWHDPARRPGGTYGLGWQSAIDDTIPDADLVLLARNWDSLCLYGWRPHMYNPQLAQWLHRIAAPTLVLWGESDGIVTKSYGRDYSALIPGSDFVTIADAGHHPELEQPHRVVEAIRYFRQGARASR